MPLSVEVKINGKPISTVHIARMGAVSRTAGINRYSALIKDAPEIETEAEWDTGVMFNHVAGDGALVCVEKALAALHAAGIAETPRT
jgi:hypothetical protein